MKIGVFSYYDICNKDNGIFDKNGYPIGENLEYPFVLLKEKLLNKNITIETVDQRPLEEFDSFLFLDFPSNNIDILHRAKSLNKSLNLVIFECEIIKKNNWIKKNHEYFDKIFTWNPELVDNEKYVKFYWPNQVPRELNIGGENKEKLCAMISGNKINYDKRELYSERIKAINWFEKNSMLDFDLYGTGWDAGVFYNFFNPFLKNKFAFKVLNKLDRDKILPNFLKKNISVYKGKVNSKRETLEKYKFSICYENAKNISGYITEKIFDSFFALCVPIYLGEINIKKYIPENCFIDYRDFKDFNEIYKYMVNMSDVEYFAYLENIKKFVLNDKLDKFNAENFVEVVIKNMKYSK